MVVVHYHYLVLLSVLRNTSVDRAALSLVGDLGIALEHKSVRVASEGLGQTA